VNGRVVSAGSILVDLTVEVPRLPELGGDVIASPPRLAVGGGYNLLYAAARQGVSTIYAGIRGTGPYGDLVAESLDALGVEYGDPDRRGDTGLCITLLDPSAERTFVTSPGVESRVTADQLAAAEVHQGDLVAVSGYDLVYEHAADQVLAWLASLPARVEVLLDPGPLVLEVRPDRWKRAMEVVTILTVNEREARLLAGSTTVRDGAGLPDGALLVVRHGEDGCTFEGGPDGHAETVVPTMPVAAVDTTGAGDTHAGVLLASLATGAPLAVALRRANIAAAISVTRPGPAAAPTRDELDQVLVTEDENPAGG
jgi:ribokinase